MTVIEETCRAYKIRYIRFNTITGLTPLLVDY